MMEDKARSLTYYNSTSTLKYYDYKLMLTPHPWYPRYPDSQVDNLNLFKFTDELQSRMEELLEKKRLTY
jgi:hypothetical protein